MVNLVKKIGIVGFYDKGNGHPFSYSAIINGYNKEKFKKLNFQVILDYLNKKKKKDFGIKGFKITHVWTQDLDISIKLSKACKIKNVVENYKEMIGKIDALIIARDNLHYKIAKPFLSANIPVFIDKPLTLNKIELEYFKKYIRSGNLMTTSCFRFSKEIKVIRTKLKQNGLKNLKYVSANIVNGLEKYGIHMLEVIEAIGLLDIKRIYKLPINFESYLFINKNNIPIHLNCFGKSSKVLNIQFYFKKGNNFTCNFNDNFTSFKNTLNKFTNMINDKKIPIDYERTKNIIELIIKTKNLNEKKF